MVVDTVFCACRFATANSASNVAKKNLFIKILLKKLSNVSRSCDTIVRVRQMLVSVKQHVVKPAVSEHILTVSSWTRDEYA